MFLMKLYDKVWTMECGCFPFSRNEEINEEIPENLAGKHLDKFRGMIMKICVPSEESFLDATDYKEANVEGLIEKIVEKLEGYPRESRESNCLEGCCDTIRFAASSMMMM